MRLTLVIPALGAGGAERVMVTLANAWAERGWPVTLLTYDDGRQEPFYELHPAITWRPLAVARRSPNALEGVRNNLRRVRAVRQAIAASRPDVVVSFLDQTNVLVLIATRGLRLPVVVAEHIDPARHPIGRIWGTLRRWSYPRAAAVVVLTESARDFFPPAVRRRTHVIPNPIVIDRPVRSASAADATSRGWTLIAAGRLSEQKGFDLLLRAFADLAPDHPRWSLEIYGEGQLRPDLERLRDELGLAGRVRMPGATRQLHQAFAAADLFVLSSRYEGFPMVLCEAMAGGLAVVSFDCPSGPGGIVRDGIDGVLVPPEDVAALTSALDRLMGDRDERRRLASRATEVLDRFGPPRVLGAWDRLLAEVRR